MKLAHFFQNGRDAANRALASALSMGRRVSASAFSDRRPSVPPPPAPRSTSGRP